MTKEEQDKITKEIIGCAMEVHNILGNGFQEVVYQRALSVEMNLRHINHEREFEMLLNYKGVDVGQRRVDFLVCGEISVEIKAIVDLDNTKHVKMIFRMGGVWGGIRTEYLPSSTIFLRKETEETLVSLNRKAA
jgi:GxxExxY protein